MSIHLLARCLTQEYAREVTKYFESVATRLQTPEGMVDYFTLAESRRRIYQPAPLNEFALTLPYAVDYGHPPTSRFKMRETGEVVPMAARGVRFYFKLTSTQDDVSLAGFDPRILPAPGEDGAERLGVAHLMSVRRMFVSQWYHNSQNSVRFITDGPNLKLKRRILRYRSRMTL
jgi:hypothetical protein